MTNYIQFDLNGLHVLSGLSVTMSMWFYSGLPWNGPGITYWWLIYLPRWLIPIHNGKVSLCLWEFTLSMACQCDLHNWILTSVLLIVCSFTRWTLQSFWIVMKSEFHSWNACLYIPLKIIVSMYNHSSTRFPYLSVNCHCGTYSTSLGTDLQFQTMCMIIPRLGWGQHADVRLARDFKWDQNHLWTSW